MRPDYSGRVRKHNRRLDFGFLVIVLVLLLVIVLFQALVDHEHEQEHDYEGNLFAFSADPPENVRPPARPEEPL